MINSIIQTLFNRDNTVCVDVRQDEFKSSRLGIRQHHDGKSASVGLRADAVVCQLKTCTNVASVVTNQ